MKRAFQDKMKTLLPEASGNVTVELALTMSVFLIVILLGVDFSRMAIEKHRLEQYARAGAQYGMVNQTNATDLTGVQTAVESAAGAAASGLTISTSNYCECPGGVGADCGDSCDDGSSTALFLSVTVSKNYDYLFSLASKAGGTTFLEGVAVIRVR